MRNSRVLHPISLEEKIMYNTMIKVKLLGIDHFKEKDQKEAQEKVSHNPSRKDTDNVSFEREAFHLQILGRSMLADGMGYRSQLPTNQLRHDGAPR